MVLKKTSLPKFLEEARNVFEENVFDERVPWESALNSYSYYLDILAKWRRQTEGNEVSNTHFAREIARCAMLLKQKSINPKGMGCSTVLWKSNNRRPL